MIGGSNRYGFIIKSNMKVGLKRQVAGFKRKAFSETLSHLLTHRLFRTRSDFLVGFTRKGKHWKLAQACQSMD